ncbi:hypothetical protein TWF730_004322 [Orbilia blumenaviensis]|uniref:Uncharacterized protein n=1 Tax=Orbilia blumenaviensis TaxID=1796055 RepID=A0AAV9U036_9PEZI
MTIPCMRILARAGTSCPALYPPSRVSLRSNGVRTGVYSYAGLRATARSVVTMVHRIVNPDQEEDDFIPDLRNCIVSAIQKEGTTTRRYVFFQATPSYAHLVSDPIFLRESIERAVKTAGYKLHRVEAAGVVIDSIPAGKDYPRAEGWSILVSDRRMKFYGDTTAAYKRFEFMPGPPSGVPDDPPPLPFNPGASRNPEDDMGSLQMVFHTVEGEDIEADSEQQQQKGENGAGAEGGKETEEQRKKRRRGQQGKQVGEKAKLWPRSFLHIKTKLANTLFQNGMPATAMIHMYGVDGTDDGSHARLHPELLRRVKDLTVYINGAQLWDARVNYRLRPLTEPRKVLAGAGNIIKSLKIPGVKGPSPASKELEAVVEKFATIRPLYDPVTLVKRPPEIFARISTTDKKILGQRVPKEDRFAKVLAGGGGWGANAGILALDSEVIEGFPPPPALKGYVKEVGDQGRTALKGKWVTFFVNDTAKRSARGTNKETFGLWRFATLGKDYTVDPGWARPAETSNIRPITDTQQEPTDSEVAVGSTDSTEAALPPVPGSEPTETAAGSIDSTTTTPPQTPDTTSIKAEGLKIVHKMPPQALHTGTDSAIWVNGHKMDIPMFAILLDLRKEVAEFATSSSPVRFVKYHFNRANFDRAKRARSAGRFANRRYNIVGLTLKPQIYDFETEKYDRELRLAQKLGTTEEGSVGVGGAQREGWNMESGVGWRSRSLEEGGKYEEELLKSQDPQYEAVPAGYIGEHLPKLSLEEIREELKRTPGHSVDCATMAAELEAGQRDEGLPEEPTAEPEIVSKEVK